MGRVLRNVPRPSFGDVEANDANRVTTLAVQQIGNDCFDPTVRWSESISDRMLSLIRRMSFCPMRSIRSPSRPCARQSRPIRTSSPRSRSCSRDCCDCWALRSGCTGTVWGWLVAGDFPSSWANAGTRLEDKKHYRRYRKKHAWPSAPLRLASFGSRKRGRFAPPVQMIKLTETREITA
jgi:hypothetical protein